MMIEIHAGMDCNIDLLVIKCNIDTFLINNIEKLASVLRFKKCFSTFPKSTAKKETKILLLNN